MVAAFLPILVALTGLLGSTPETPIRALLAGLLGAVGTFLSGHNSRTRAVSFAFSGGLLGVALSRLL